MDRYAVIGNPVEHSRSPRIHALFARQTRQSLGYEKLLAPLDDFAGTVRRFQDEGGRGANVTLPFKLEALKLCEVLSERARRAGAVNTLTLTPDRQIQGDNTDGAGLLRDLTVNYGLDLDGLRILLLGAGGAVRGTLPSLLEAAPAAIWIANRTPAKALALAADFSGDIPVEACGYFALEGEAFDMIINGTSSGLTGETPPLPGDVLKPGGICYDMLYGDAPTPFLRWAATHGAGVLADGLGMLVEQAAESFLIWRGLRPDTQPVLKQLRAEL
ncbi:MAG: shikimate dehydrogenase [Nevskiales bacterium]